VSAQSYVHTPAHMVTRTLGPLPPPLQIFAAPPWIPCNLYDVRKIPQTEIGNGRNGQSGGRGALGIGWRPDAVRRKPPPASGIKRGTNRVGAGLFPRLRRGAGGGRAGGFDMAKSKRLENQTKHLTKSEVVARSTAEAVTLPTRTQVTITLPARIRGDRLAVKYWRATLHRMKTGDVEILDDLDTETLATYCTMLSRRDRLNDLCSKLVDGSTREDLTLAEQLKATDALDGLAAKLSSLESGILRYAEKLGLTPASRIGMARKKSQAEASEKNDDLFGD